MSKKKGYWDWWKPHPWDHSTPCKICGVRPTAPYSKLCKNHLYSKSQVPAEQPK